MTRLPQPGGDKGDWGVILNDFLSQSHADDGKLKTDSVGAPQLRPQSVTNAAIADQTIAEQKLSASVQTKLNTTTLSDDSVTTSKIADKAVTIEKIDGVGEASGLATLGSDGFVPDTQLPTRLSDAGLKSTISTEILPLRRRGNRAIGIGDSIMIGSDGPFSGYAGSWFSRLSEMSGQRLRRSRNAGVAGQSTSSMLARIQTDVIAFNPDICVLEVVTPNDIGQSLTLEQSKANIISMINQVVAAGIRPIVCTGPPSDTTAVRDRLNQTSAWLIEYANARGIAVLDLYTPLVDPADGTYLSAYTADGVHPNAAGQEAVAAYLNTHLPRDLNEVPLLSRNAGDVTNLLLNGVFIGDSNSDGVANSWTGVSLASASLEARSDGFGNWQVITGDAGTDYLSQSITGWAIGETLVIAGEWINVNSNGINVQVNFTGGTPYSQPRAISGRSEVFSAGRTFYMEVVVPTGTTACQIRLVPGVGTAKFSLITVKKLLLA